MALDIGTLPTDVPNEMILDAVRNESSPQYQERIPSATQAGIQNTIGALMDPANRRWKNEFIDALVNRIGLVIARNNSWTNPLAPFKSGMMTNGATIEEIQVGLLKSHNYDPDRDQGASALFSRERPEVQANFHTVNRQEYYKVTINEHMLNRAFLAGDGLSGFIAQLMDAPTTSDNLDEFLLTTSLFGEYEANGGFYHVNVPDVASYSSGQEEARMASRKMRAMARNLTFLSTSYNAAKMPVHAKPEDLILLTTPEFEAAIDVESLAGAFNIDKASLPGRIVPIPAENFAIDGCQAIMTTKDFFVIADTLFESTSQWNPAQLSNNYFLHHHQIISASRFVPAVMFTTGHDDEVIVVHTSPESVSAISFLPGADGVVPTEVAHGGLLAMSATVSPEAANQSLAWSVSGTVALSSGTFITASGVLHIGLDEKNTSLTVTATTTSRNPDDKFEQALTKTKTVTISDGPLTQWPIEHAGEVVGIIFKGEELSGFDPETLNYPLSLASSVEVNPSDVEVVTTGDVNVTITKTTSGTAPQITLNISTQISPLAAPVVYKIQITQTS